MVISAGPAMRGHAQRHDAEILRQLHRRTFRLGQVARRQDEEDETARDLEVLHRDADRGKDTLAKKKESKRNDPASHRGLPGNAVPERRRRIAAEGQKHRGKAHGIDGYE